MGITRREIGQLADRASRIRGYAIELSSDVDDLILDCHRVYPELPEALARQAMDFRADIEAIEAAFGLSWPPVEEPDPTTPDPDEVIEPNMPSNAALPAPEESAGENAGSGNTVEPEEMDSAGPPVPPKGKK